MDLKQAESLAIRLMSEHGILDMGYHFAWNNKKRAAGTCSYRKKQIQLSKPLTTYSILEDVTDTILHEIAHALAGYSAGHGYEWQRVAKSIGCNANKYYDEKNKKSTADAFKIIAKYKAVCEGCGKESFKNRMPKRRFACSTCCKGVWNENFILTFRPQ